MCTMGCKSENTKSGVQATTAEERHEEKQKVFGQMKAQKEGTKAEGSL